MFWSIRFHGLVRVSLLLGVALGLSVARANAQSGYVEGEYYAQAGARDLQCGNAYPVLAGTDWYGNPMYAYVQDCQVRDWQSVYGSYSGYVWACGGYGCAWQVQTQNRTWWYFTWNVYQRRVG